MKPGRQLRSVGDGHRHHKPDDCYRTDEIRHVVGCDRDARSTAIHDRLPIGHLSIRLVKVFGCSTFNATKARKKAVSESRTYCLF